jgi:hypothetical protein
LHNADNRSHGRHCLFNGQGGVFFSQHVCLFAGQGRQGLKPQDSSRKTGPQPALRKSEELTGSVVGARVVEPGPIPPHSVCVGGLDLGPGLFPHMSQDKEQELGWPEGQRVASAVYRAGHLQCLLCWLDGCEARTEFP